jgi:hypothetical protein
MRKRYDLRDHSSNESMQKCPKCGHENPDVYLFCTECLGWLFTFVRGRIGADTWKGRCG